MAANAFIVKLKADGSVKDWTDLDIVLKEYEKISAGLAEKDKGAFAVNVLCILCRNLEKVPSWRTTIDNRALVALSLECTLKTKSLNVSEQVKTLACIYHIHKHVIRQVSSVPPEMVLKLSHLPFETDTTITEYSKTYWNIIADRIAYIEKLKSMKLNILNILPKLTENVLQVIRMYNTVQFCSAVLTFLLKKLHYLYNDMDPNKLNNVFGKIFDEMHSKTDLRSFKKLSDKDLFDIYTKLNDCLYVVAENCSKIRFSNSVLNTVVQICLNMIGHRQDLLHCFQNAYLNGFCMILDDKQDLTIIETVLTNFVPTCETAEKLGYVKAMNATYPYINQCLRLYIDFKTANTNWQQHFPEQIRNACLKLMNFLLMKLKHCNQVLKCENCTVKSGLHDALRLSFLVKTFIATPLEHNLDITKTLPTYLNIVSQQYVILKDLCTMGCVNYEKCYRKLQSDVHNTAILLNKTQHYEYSIKLFEIYLKNEILHFKSEGDMKNISRALYNKSICELDCKQYDSALLDAYLSLIFAYPDGLSSEKYMSLVMDIKAKVIKTTEEADSQFDSEANDLQTMTVLDACCLAIEKKLYGSLKPFFCNLKFSTILRHEFQMYVKLWPSVAPVAGVWKSLYDLTLHDVPWSNVTDECVRNTLQEVILLTPTIVRTIHHKLFADVVTDLLQEYDESPPEDLELRIFHSTLTFLKAEYDLAEASTKYGWKRSEQNVDPDQSEATRTLLQEHAAAKRAIQAVYMWSDIAKQVGTVRPPGSLRVALHTAQVFVPYLLYLYRTTHGLRLAHSCCVIARLLDDQVSFATNASALLYHANSRSQELSQVVATASEVCASLIRSDCVEPALVLLTRCAIYYSKTNSPVMAAKILQYVQTKLYSYHTQNETKLDLAWACLYEAQIVVCKRNELSDVIGAHRQFLNVGNAATKWTTRRHRSLSLRMYITSTGLLSASLCRSLRLWRRARSGAGGALSAGPGAAQAALFYYCANPAANTATVVVDNRLKYVLGLQPSSNLPSEPVYEKTKKQNSQLEIMLDTAAYKKHQLSPTFNCMTQIPRFKMPFFFEHNSDCQCYACEISTSLILGCQTANLEASIYFNAKQYDAASHYFDGTLKCLEIAENKLKSLPKIDTECYIDNIVEKKLMDEFKEVQIEILTQIAFFELSQESYKKADEFIVKLQEILQENANVNVYLKNDVLNLVTTAARLKKSTNLIKANFDLDAEFDNLRLSPPKPTTAAKTPESNAKNIPKITRITAKQEDVPNTKRKVIKLNLDEDPDENKNKRTSKRTEFKIPVPVINKAVLESVTPVTTRKKPDIIVTHHEASSSEFATPKPQNDKNDFFTPLDKTTEDFFTPMSTLKTYSKRTLRQGIVKNLEQEFFTPEVKTKELNKTVEVNKENKTDNSESSITKPKKETNRLKSLKRATSPGKLEKNDTNSTRPSRLRKPAKLNLDK